MSNQELISEQAAGIDSILIVGGGKLTEEFLRVLPPEDKVIIIDSDAQREEVLLTNHPERHLTFISGDASSALVLEKAGIEKVNWLIVLVRNDSLAHEICFQAYERFS